MAKCFILFNSILSILLYLTQSQSTFTSLPKNGTFIITTYKDNNCEETTDISGYIPTEKYWKIKAFNSILMPVNFNQNISRFTYKDCVNDINGCDSNSEVTMFCGNECTQTTKGGIKIYYSCNFMPKSNLSLFTFTGFGDSGCNNNNGNSYPLPLTKACWTLEDSGSMSITSFIERRMTLNIYSTNNCIGKIKEYHKGLECDESCIDNPINDVPVYYQCKYTSSSFMQLTLTLLLLNLVLLF